MADITVEPFGSPWYLGSDLDVVNAARVSFDKASEWLPESQCPTDPVTGGKVAPYKRLSERDTKLIHFLARENHWSPFAHCFARFRITAPVFVARQLQKHTVGLAWNEVSRRYVDTEPTFYQPETWRKRAENVKQGSSDEVVTELEVWDPVIGFTGHKWDDVGNFVHMIHDHMETAYQSLLKAGVCPEQARMVLPQSMMTEWIWSGSLYAFARVCNLRLDGHAQRETGLVAQGISKHLAEVFPVSWEALTSCGSSL